jgi:hypothetical protein
MRSRLVLVPLVGLALLVPAGSASAAGFVAHLSAPTHHPLANKLWHIKVTATTSSGKALKATASYQFIYAGQVVARRNPSPKSPCDENGAKRPLTFTGKYSDDILWPPRSIGIPLTFRVVVSVKGRGTKKLDYKVVVRKSRYKHCTR